MFFYQDGAEWLGMFIAQGLSNWVKVLQNMPT